jgi:O-antigen/teichoic acid export membrane protein
MNIKRLIFSYSAINVINASIPFLLLPVLTAYLSQDDYGRLSLIQLLMTISFPFILMNTHGLINIEYSKLSKQGIKDMISTLVLMAFAGVAFLEIIFYIFEIWIVKYFHIPVEYVYYIPLFVFFQAIPIIVLALYQAKQEPMKFGLFKIGMALSNLTFSLMLVVVWQMNWEGRVIGIAVSFLLFSLIGLKLLYDNSLLYPKANMKFFKMAMKFGLPLIPHTIAGLFLSMSDRVMLANILGTDSVGLYSVAFQVASAVMILMSSINQAWIPVLYEKLNTNPTYKEKVGIVKTTYKIMAGMVGISIIFIIIYPIIFTFFVDAKFFEAQNIVPYIVLAFLFQGFYYMFTNYIFYSKKTHILSYITVFSVCIVLISNYYLINLYGVIGAAYAMILVYLVFFLLVWYFANKIYAMPWFKFKEE